MTVGRFCLRVMRLAQALMACVLLLGGIAVQAAVTAAPAPTLAPGTEVATAGFYRLDWDNPTDTQPLFELQAAENANFRGATTVYHGPDTATVFSGQSDGTYHYRVRIDDPENGAGAWSEAVTVTVDHHPLERAYAFFAAGAVVFIATLALIVSGTLRTQPRE